MKFAGDETALGPFRQSDMSKFQQRLSDNVCFLMFSRNGLKAHIFSMLFSYPLSLSRTLSGSLSHSLSLSLIPGPQKISAHLSDPRLQRCCKAQLTSNRLSLWRQNISPGDRFNEATCWLVTSSKRRLRSDLSKYFGALRSNSTNLWEINKN